MRREICPLETSYYAVSVSTLTLWPLEVQIEELYFPLLAYET